MNDKKTIVLLCLAVSEYKKYSIRYRDSQTKKTRRRTVKCNELIKDYAKKLDIDYNSLMFMIQSI